MYSYYGFIISPRNKTLQWCWVKNNDVKKELHKGRARRQKDFDVEGVGKLNH